MDGTAGERGRRGRYRVEHRVGAAAVVLARGWDVAPRRAALAPYATAFANARGKLVLIDEATGAVVACRRLLGPIRG
jgi:hypothetical protein